MPMTSYLKDKLANHVFAETPYPMPNQVQMILSLDELSDTSGLTGEVTAASYSRIVLDINGNVIENNGIITNTDLVAYPKATEDWGIIKSIGVVDDNDNLLIFEVLATPITVNTDMALGFLPNDIEITFI